MVEKKNLKEKPKKNKGVNTKTTTKKSKGKKKDPSFPIEKVETNEVVKVEEKPVVTLSSSKDEIVKRIQETSDMSELQDLTNLFGLSLTKGEILRASKESDLMDLLLAQIEKRIVTKADYMSHQDLLDYIKTLQTNVDKSRKTFNDDVEQAGVKIVNNHTEIKIENIDATDGMSRESREKVISIMKSIFASANDNSGSENNKVEEPQEIEVPTEENKQDD